MKAGTTRRCISAMAASNPCATPCTSLLGNPPDRKNGPWTSIDANARKAKATVWLFAPWPTSGSGSSMRCGSSTKAMSRRHSWLHVTPMASSRPEVAAESGPFAGLSTAKTPCCFLPSQAQESRTTQAQRCQGKRSGLTPASGVVNLLVPV
jgi:hypothetical protein